MNKKLRLFVCLSIFFIFLFSNSAIAQENFIRIGMLSPVTGTYGAMSNHQIWAAEMAIAEINAKGGVLGRKLKLFVEDTQQSPAVAATKAEKLILSDQIDFMLGPIISGEALNVMRVVNKHKKVMVITIAESAKITGSSCDRYTFRINQNAGIEARTITSWLVENVGKNFYFMAMDFEWGRDSTAQYKALVLENGGTVLGETYFPLGSKDLSPYFGKILKAKPDVLFCTAAGNDAIQLVNQLAEFGLKDRMQVAGAGSLVSGDILPAQGKNANGILAADRYNVGIDTPENKEFVEKFEKAYKQIPNKFSVSTYEGTYLIAQAVEKAGTLDPEKVIPALEGFKFKGPQGEKIIRAEDHQAIINMYVLKCLDGKQIIVGSKSGSDVIGPVSCPGF